MATIAGRAGARPGRVRALRRALADRGPGARGARARGRDASAPTASPSSARPTRCTRSPRCTRPTSPSAPRPARDGHEPRAAAGRSLGTVDRIGLKIGKKDVLDTDPAADTDARVVEVEIRLDDPQQVAGLTNLAGRRRDHPGRVVAGAWLVPPPGSATDACGGSRLLDVMMTRHLARLAAAEAREAAAARRGRRRRLRRDPDLHAARLPRRAVRQLGALPPAARRRRRADQPAVRRSSRSRRASRAAASIRRRVSRSASR